MSEPGTTSGQKRPRSAEKALLPTKGLLQFGFTETSNSNSTLSTEQSQCPHCCGLYLMSAVVEHSEQCSYKVTNVTQPVEVVISDGHNDKNPQPSKVQRNAFDVMKSSSALKPKCTTAAGTSVYFTLLLKDQKLYPEFSTQPFQHDHAIPQEFPVWMCDSNVRKFRWQFRHNGLDCVRDVKLHLSTNIPSNTRIISSSSLAAAAGATSPISIAMLKSMLQKAVRRRQALKAIKLCAALCPRDQDIISSSSAATSLTGDVASAQLHSGRSPVSSPQKSALSSAQSPSRSSYAKATGVSPAAGSSKRSAVSSSTAGAAAAHYSTIGAAGPQQQGGANNSNSPLSELLRRLPIVCLEDAALHPALPIVTWLMVAASKGYEPCEWLVNVVLLMVADVATCAYKDCIPPYDTPVHTPPVSAPLKLSSSSAMESDTTASSGDTVGVEVSKGSTQFRSWENISNSSVRTLLASVAIRASFGGMGGDMKMLDKYTELWYERLVGDKVGLEKSNLSSDSGADNQSYTKVVAALLPSVHSCMYTYIHSTYTNAFFDGETTPASANSWAVQLFENFPPILEPPAAGASINSTVSPTRTRTDITHVVQNQLRDVCIHLTTTAATASSASDSAALSIAPPRHGSLSNILKVTVKDTVPEGIDHHVDWGLVPHLLNVCRGKLENYIQQQQLQSAQSSGTSSSKMSSTITVESLEEDTKSAIWTFRSSSNSRKLYPYLHSQTHSGVSAAIVHFNKQLTDRELAEKRRLAKLWSIICPDLVAYCDRKIAVIGKRL